MFQRIKTREKKFSFERKIELKLFFSLFYLLVIEMINIRKLSYALHNSHSLPSLKHSYSFFLLLVRGTIRVRSKADSLNSLYGALELFAGIFFFFAEGWKGNISLMPYVIEFLKNYFRLL